MGTIGEELLEERRRRRVGDRRITPKGCEILRRVTHGDLADESKPPSTPISLPTLSSVGASIQG